MTQYEPPLINTGFGTVVESGTVMSFDSRSPIRITFGPLNERLTVVFAFKEDEIDKKRRLGFEPTGDREVTFTLVNSYAIEGHGTTEPIKLGLIRGLSLYINFRVFAWKPTIPRTLHYTLYERDDVKANRIMSDAFLRGLGVLKPPSE